MWRTFAFFRDLSYYRELVRRPICLYCQLFWSERGGSNLEFLRVVFLDFDNVRLTTGSCAVRKNITSAMTWNDRVARQAALVTGNMRAGIVMLHATVMSHFNAPSTRLLLLCPQPCASYQRIDQRLAETGGWLPSQPSLDSRFSFTGSSCGKNESNRRRRKT